MTVVSACFLYSFYRAINSKDVGCTAQSPAFTERTDNGRGRRVVLDARNGGIQRRHYNRVYARDDDVRQVGARGYHEEKGPGRA